MTRAPRWMLDLIAVHQETTQAAGYSVPSLSGVSLLQIPRRLAFCQNNTSACASAACGCGHAQRIRTRRGHERVMKLTIHGAGSPAIINHAARRHCRPIRASVPLVPTSLWDPPTTDSRRRGTSSLWRQLNLELNFFSEQQACPPSLPSSSSPPHPLSFAARRYNCQPAWLVAGVTRATKLSPTPLAQQRPPQKPSSSSSPQQPFPRSFSAPALQQGTARASTRAFFA